MFRVCRSMMEIGIEVPIFCRVHSSGRVTRDDIDCGLALGGYIACALWCDTEVLT